MFEWLKSRFNIFEPILFESSTHSGAQVTLVNLGQLAYILLLREGVVLLDVGRTSAFVG